MCDLKHISQRLNRVFTQFDVVSDETFLQLAMQYLVITLECQVYYHLGDYSQTNWIPRLMNRLARIILEPYCDHSVLLEMHPRLVRGYTECLEALKCHEHTFSSDGNQIKVQPYSGDEKHVKRFEFHLSYVVAIFWESCYARGLDAAQKSFT